MPGHNHYPWCTCGWCVKYGMGRYQPAQLESYFDRFSAQRFLERHGAHRSRTACFVSPNASCPVCGARVFYYENAHGSRVFFDELGPPWPKHPCTDRSDQRPRQIHGPPTRRPRGIILELIDAARKVSPDRNDAPHDDPVLDRWTLMEAIKIDRSGWQNTVVAEFVGAPAGSSIRFTFDSADEVLKVGDIFSLRPNEISLFDTHRMKAKNYKIKVLETAFGADET